jgi:hypothetical protein
LKRRIRLGFLADSGQLGKLGLLVSILWLTGCVTYNGKRAIVPLFEVDHHESKLGGMSKLSPADAAQESVTSTEVIVRPLGSFESIGEDRARLKILWPLWDSSWGAGYHRATLLPFLFYRQRPIADGEGSDVDFILFPFIYAGHEPDAGGYFGIFPLGGVVKGLFAKDRTYFFMFPLYWHTFDEDWNSMHLVWPFFNRASGETHRGWRVWPFYGHYEADTADGRPRSRRTFVIWPFYIDQETELNSNRPTKTFFTLPFYGHSHNVRTDTRVYLWPFFHVTEDIESGNKLYFGYLIPYRFTHGQFDVWPLFGVKDRVISTKNDILDNRGITLPGGWMGLSEEQLETEAPRLLEKVERGELENVRTRFRQFAIWPIQQYENARSADLDATRFYLLPFFWHFWTERKGETGNQESEWKVWPLFRARFTDNQDSVYFPSPLWFRQENLFERLYARLWRLFLYENTPERSGWEFFFGLVSRRHENAEDATTMSIFYGLLEGTSSPDGFGMRVLWLPWR